MNKKIIYLVASLILFNLLFYRAYIGLNLGLFFLLVGVVHIIFNRETFRKSWNYKIVAIGYILSCFSSMYYVDFSSFLGILISFHLLAYFAFDPHLKWIKSLLLIPLNYLLSFPRFFQIGKIDKPTIKTDKILIVYILPIAILIVFLLVYMGASDILESILYWEIDISFATIFWLSILGMSFLYPFITFSISKEGTIYGFPMQNTFSNQPKTSNPLLLESAKVTFTLLNILLLIFIFIYGYENFFITDSTETISQNVHERVYAVIGSILLAICLIMFYFQRDNSASQLHKTIGKYAKIWVALNSILVLLTFLKNSEYIYLMGLTYKRLGVYAFLLLCGVGLFFTFRKIHYNKTNWFLIQKMTISLYLFLIFIIPINWGWVIMKYNIAVDKVDPNYFYQIDYAHETIYNYMKENNLEIEGYILYKNENSTLRLDKSLYEYFCPYE